MVSFVFVMSGFEQTFQLSQVFLLAGVADVKIAGNVGTALEDGCPTPDDYELYVGVAEPLDCDLKVHVSPDLRIAPRTDSAICASSCMRRARSAGLS